MANNISIGELRQNPTGMLRDVKAGATYTVTDRGVPVAEIVARREPRWVPAEEVDALLQDLGADEVWAGEIAEGRAAEDVRDPWESAG